MDLSQSEINTQETETKQDHLIFENFTITLQTKTNSAPCKERCSCTGEHPSIKIIYKQKYPQNIDASGIPKQDILQLSPTSLTAYGGGNIPHFGTCEIPCAVKGIKSKELCYVTKVNWPAIIGYETSKKLGLVTINWSAITNEQTNNK